MELGRAFLKNIQTLSTKVTSSPEPLYETIKTDTFELNLAITDVDSLSSQIETLNLTKVEKEGPDLTRIKSQATQLEHRITYLLEDLALIELDSYDCKAQVKSKIPRFEGDSITYYEFLLDKGDALSLVRTRFDKEQGTKTRIPMTFTLEVMERLLNDISTILS